LSVSDSRLFSTRETAFGQWIADERKTPSWEGKPASSLRMCFYSLWDTTRQILLGYNTTRQQKMLSQSSMMVKMKNPFHDTLSDNNSMFLAHLILTTVIVVWKLTALTNAHRWALTHWDHHEVMEGPG
jgi:hypothetical protein